MIDIDTLERLVNQFRQNLSYYKTSQNAYNEHSCRIEYIDPMLEILGWDVANKRGLAPQYREVIAENYSTKNDRPDYSLTIRGVTKLFVEAKKPSVDISKDPVPAMQTRKYGWNAGHKIAVLTNFEYLIIYDTTIIPKEGDRCTVARYRIYHYEEYLEKIDEICCLISRDTVYSGEFEKLFDEKFPDRNNKTQQVDDYFLTQINGWRVALSNELYKKGGKYSSLEVLNDVVQGFINQIVFLRICEDKNLPMYHQLKETIADEDRMQEKLEELFRKADKRYNSGMFSGENIIFNLTSKVIIEMIEGLYYPQSPYLFNIIEPNMLGRIYEAFLTEQLICKDGIISLAKKKDCVNRSVVTTPTEIVKYMVEKTLTPLCEGLKPEQIKKLKIADIACGSGVFLEEVFAFLQSKCVDWYSQYEPEHLDAIDGCKRKLPLSEKKELLTSCVYGVDIDVHAVEVAKFSLLIKLIEDETAPSVADSNPILPDLSNNLFHGNSLVGKHELAGKHLNNEELVSIAPFDWEEMGVEDGFDAIVGNPPYVNTEGMHALLPEIEVEIYKKKYASSFKQFDKYFIFLERAIKNIKSGGYVCYIVPNKFYKIKAGEKLRKLLSDKKMLVSLDDFGDAQLFEDKTIYSSIVFLQKTEHEEFIYTNVETAGNLWAGKEVNSITLRANTLNKLPWRLTTDFEFLEFLKKIDEVAVPITKYVELFNGIQTSAETPDPVYWFSSDAIKEETDDYYVIEKNGSEYHIEKSILRPFFKPTKRGEKGLNSYSVLQTNKQIIFPYDGNGKPYTIDVMEREFPGTFDYLRAYYDRLVPKSVSAQGKRDVQYATRDTWYQYGRTQALTAFTDTPKLIVGILSKDPMYAYDRSDMLIASGGTAGYCAINKKEGSPYDLEYIQAWLTNPYTEKIIEIVGSDFENGFTSRGTFVLETLPFIELDFTNDSQKALYDRVVEYTREIYELNHKLSERPTKSVANITVRRKKELISRIESIISRVYRLEF